MNNKIDQSQYKIYEYQIGGRTLMLKSVDNTKILKKILQINELNFFKYMNSLHASHLNYPLNQYIPKFISFMDLEQQVDYSTNQAYNLNPKIAQWMKFIQEHDRNKRQTHNIYIEMENFCYSYKKLNIVDIKLGQMPSHEQNLLAIQKNVKITGILKTKRNGQAEFGSRYQTKTIATQQQLKTSLAWFFIDENDILHQQMIKYTIQKLQQLSLILRSFTGYLFKSSSVCLLYDSDDLNKYEIKLIDFGKSYSTGYEEGYDQQIINGISNLIIYYIDILNDVESYSADQIKYEQNLNVSAQNRKKNKIRTSNQNKLREQLLKTTN